MKSAVRIGIAVVESAGRILVGERSPDSPLPGLAEFPGGKCESDETPRACAVRECQEETGLIIIPKEQIATIEHSYPHGDVELHFWRCVLGRGLPEMAPPATPFRWITFDELATLKFPEANRSILEQLLQKQ